MFTYTLIWASPSILRSDGAVIPADPANQDFQSYLAWVAAGNTASPAPTPAPATTITAGDFLNRFTPGEQAAVQAACQASAQLALGLTMGLALGSINLTSPTLSDWMGGLVAAGAITSARSTAIMTP